jgi:ribosomal protein S4
MARRLPSKPRYKISYRVRSKISFTKNSRLRRFFSIRGRQLIRRRRLFTRIVLVANKIKWVIARRFLRPYTRVKSGRSRRLTYRDNFYAKQQFRAFFGKIEEQSFRQLIKSNKYITTKIGKSFYSTLESRLDVILYRIRFLPTIFACNQYIRRHGIFLGEGVSHEPHYSIRPGTLISFAPKIWPVIYDHRLTRVFYRLYGTWLMRTRQRRRFIKKFRWLTQSIRRTRTPYYSLRRWGQLIRTFEYLRKNRIASLRHWRAIFLQFSLVNSEIMHSFFTKLNAVEVLSIKIERDLRQHGRTLSRLISMRYFSGASFKNFLTNSVVAYSYTYVIRQRRLVLGHLISLAEQSFYERSFSDDRLLSKDLEFPLATIKTRQELLRKRRRLLEQRLTKNSAQIKLQTGRFLRQREPNNFSHVRIQPRPVLPARQQRLSSAAYFLLHQRRKLRRQRRLPRLKKVHWHIPSYRHFDARTLQVARIRAPQLTELHYPFRSSISKILSFYKSRGF